MIYLKKTEVAICDEGLNSAKCARSRYLIIKVCKMHTNKTKFIYCHTNPKIFDDTYTTIPAKSHVICYKYILH